MIAVMGAAGNVGSKVVDLLVEGGEKVRALQHGRDLMALMERGVEVVEGDAMNRGDLETFFEGAVARSSSCRRAWPIRTSSSTGR